jgi:hypothetical protein
VLKFSAHFYHVIGSTRLSFKKRTTADPGWLACPDYILPPQQDVDERVKLTNTTLTSATQHSSINN